MTTAANVEARPAASALAAAVLSRGKDERQDDIEDKIGHVPENVARVGGVAADRLRSLVERIEKLEEERKALGSDIKDIFTEAKSAGFDVKVLRELIRLRKKDANEIEEQESLLDIYKRALGM